VPVSRLGVLLELVFPSWCRLTGAAGSSGAVLAQVVAVRVDERRPVLRGALQPLGLFCAGVALDRVQGQVLARAHSNSPVPFPVAARECQYTGRSRHVTN
jgi:hypothetical protein